MSEISINNQIIIDSVEHVLTGLKNQTVFSDVDINDVVEYVRSQDNTVFYLDDHLALTAPMSPDAVYLWVDTGFLSKYNSPLFI